MFHSGSEEVRVSSLGLRVQSSEKVLAGFLLIFN